MQSLLDYQKEKMKNKRSILFFVGIITFQLSAGVQFVDQSSTLELSTGTTLNVGSGGMVINGTLVHSTGSTCTGEEFITFSDGILERNNRQAVLSAKYDASGAVPVIVLDGDKSIDAGVGFIVGDVVVFGDGNRLGGYPVLSSTLSLASSVGLTCDIVGVLNKPISLNGGVLTLARDLSCVNDVAVIGNGTVSLDGHRFLFAGDYQSALTGNITWDNAKNLELRGKVPLSGTWVFSGVSKLDGNGEMIDLSSNGVIRIKSGATLTLRDVHIRGITSANLIFEDNSSQLRLERARLELSSDVTTTVGGIYVENDSIIILKNYDWTFDQSASLTVDSATLSLNVYNNATLPDAGTINVPNAVYIDHVWQTSHVSDNQSAGNLTIINGGVIAEVGERLSDPLLSSNLGGLVQMEHSSLMGPSDTIQVKKDTVINGQGAQIWLARTQAPQITIEADKTLTLKNVELYGVTSSTFKFNHGSKLKIQDNVILHLAEDITFTKGIIIVDGDANVFSIKGIGQARRLTFSSAPMENDRILGMSYNKHLVLGSNTLRLESVLLSGLNHIQNTSAVVDGAVVNGAIALDGDATVEVDSIATDLYFTVKGFNNRLNILKHKTTFNGQLTFDDYAVSSLFLSFVSSEKIAEDPYVVFGDAFMRVSSTRGQAYLVVDAHVLGISNKTEKSFLVGRNGFLKGESIVILQNPIGQTDSQFTLWPGTQLTSGLSQGALVVDEALGRSFGLYRSTASTLRQYVNYLASIEQGGEDDALLRAIKLPNRLTEDVFQYGSAFTLPELGGNVELRENKGHVFTNFKIHPAKKLNLTLNKGVKLVQAECPLSVKSDDIINCIGGNNDKTNCIRLRDYARIDGQVFIDSGAVLEFLFDEQNSFPILYFSKESFIEIGFNGRLIVSGRGDVVFDDQCLIRFLQSGGRIVLRDEARLVLQEGQRVMINGRGVLQVVRGAQVVVENGSQLLLGTGKNDSVCLTVKEGGAVRVGDVFTSPNKKQSKVLALGENIFLDFAHMGSLVIGNNGVFACNVGQEKYWKGNIRRIDFSVGGSLYIAQSGQLIFGENSEQRSDVSWNMLGGTIGGSGLIAFAGSGLKGRLQGRFGSYNESCVHDLICKQMQVVPTLKTSVVFIGEDNRTYLYTKNRKIVLLPYGAFIVSDDENGTVYGYEGKANKQFAYTVNGERL